LTHGSKGKKAGDPPDAKSEALKFLSYRARSTKEVVEKLKTKGITTSEIDETLEWLTGAGYLNDVAFARERASARVRTKHWGSIKIASELRSIGVAPEVVEEVLGEIDGADELETALNALTKWARINGVTPTNTEGSDITLKAARHLRSRGFPTSVTGTALKEFFKPEPDKGNQSKPG
jgi:regulatory protein